MKWIGLVVWVMMSVILTTIITYAYAWGSTLAPSIAMIGAMYLLVMIWISIEFIKS